MNTLAEPEVRLFVSARGWIVPETVRQLYAASELEGVRLAVGFPDLHPGSTTPVGAAFVTEDVIYPPLIASDIGCGLAFFQTDLLRRDAKVERWSELRFNLEHPWEEFVSGFLEEQELESTEFDSELGTLGGSNHFAELLTIETVEDPTGLKQFGLGKQQLVLLVHSGSRELSESIFDRYTKQQFSQGAETESFAAREYLREHERRVCGDPRFAGFAELSGEGDQQLRHSCLVFGSRRWTQMVSQRKPPEDARTIRGTTVGPNRHGKPCHL
jgi:release factor H-coupled RctB family protein